MSLKKNILGRVYQHGIGLSVGLRSFLIQEQIENGSICEIWKRYVQEGTYTPQMRHKKGRPKLAEPDKELIELLKRDTPSMTGK